MTQIPMRWFVSAVLAVLALLVTVTAFRGYLNPDFLLGFANIFSC
jgi:hypothetical protein